MIIHESESRHVSDIGIVLSIGITSWFGFSCVCNETSLDDILPDKLFSSPTKLSVERDSILSNASTEVSNNLHVADTFSNGYLCPAYQFSSQHDFC